MKKYLYLCLLVMPIFVACTSQEEKQKKANEQAAVECVKWTLKCPSTMEVVSVSQVYSEPEIQKDTMYHLMAKHGKYTSYFDVKFWDKIEAVTIDSLKEFSHAFPAYTMCFVSYDAQNSYGAMVRGNQNVAILEDGTAMLFEDFFSKYYEKPEIRTWAIEPRKYTNIDSGIKYKEEGTWLSKEDLFGIEFVKPVGME